ncbi:triose-phosphate isomerase [Rubrivirga marina]|uniref:Triosephosphate isomerase n=1 Tax=Rubrivirga marina TaxID=1196024 RepID=A0A271J3E0_9BACT|nr:triose-phosphate isomerase [Rubrivirga marina]PAP77475.1 triose-phosphate isomerase [Rubrivirga marina]
MLVAGNWKMNLGHADAVGLAADVVQVTADATDAVGVAVCPPAVWLDAVAERLRDSGVRLGAQNVHPEESGAFTGEVSPPMLRDLGVHYVIVGHSERRQLFGETSAFAAEKVRSAQAAGLVPILCVGETLDEREAGDAEATVLDQLAASLDGVEAGDLVVAYEPVWAIGTGRTASPEQAQAMHAAIRGALADRFTGGDGIEILYGGSVKPGNAAELFAQPDLDGALVGGASLDAESFAAIVAAAREAR